MKTNVLSMFALTVQNNGNIMKLNYSKLSFPLSLCETHLHISGPVSEGFIATHHILSRRQSKAVSVKKASIADNKGNPILLALGAVPVSAPYLHVYLVAGMLQFDLQGSPLSLRFSQHLFA